MNKTIRFAAWAVACFVLAMPVQAQVRLADYILVAENNHNTYNSIASRGTSMSFTSADDGYATCTLPFAMPFGTATLASGSRIACSANGFIFLGESTTSSTYVSSPSGHKVIQPFLCQDGYMGRSGTSRAYYYHNSVDSTFTIEYVNLNRYSSPYGSINYQVVLRPSGNISIIFGSVDVGGYSTTLKCYLSNSNTDNIALSGTWASPTQSTSTSTTMPYSPLPSYMQYNFYRVIGSCPPPAAFHTTNVTADSCTLLWSEMGQATMWILEYADSAFLPGCYQGNLIYVFDTIYYLDNLQPNTTYHAYVHSDCGGDTSINRYLTFTTSCTSLQRTSLPISENFESGTFANCWGRYYRYNNTVSDGSGNVTINTSYAASGSRGCSFYASGSGSTAYMVLPMMADSAGGLDIVFDMYNSTYARIKVYTLPSPDRIDSGYVVRTIVTDGSNLWRNYEVPIVNVPPRHRYVALAAYYENNYAQTYIDNIELMVHSSCPRPQSIGLIGPATAAQTTVAWYGNDPNVMMWNVALVSQDGDPDTCQNILMAYDSTYQFFNLRSGASYDVYVRSDCYSETSSWRGPFNFVTGVYEMQATGTDTIYTCSAIITDNGGLNGNYSVNCNFTVVVYSGNMDSTLRFTGSYRTESSYDRLYVYDGVGTTGTMLLNASGSGSINNPISSTGNALTIKFTSDGSTQYDGFRLNITCGNSINGGGGGGGNGGGGGGISCANPTGLNNPNTTTTSATVTWRESGNFQVSYKKATATNWSSPIGVSASTYTFSGLTAATDYDWRVCRVCSVGNNSDWSSSTFTTAEDVQPEPCDPPTDIVISNVTPHAAYISWTGSGTFEVSYKIDNAPSWSDPITIASNHFDMDNLLDTTVYMWRVRKVCSDNGLSDWVDTFFTTLDGSGIGSIDAYGTTIALYPNPASSGSSVTVTVGGADGFVAVSLLDVKGCKLHNASQICTSDCTLRFDLPAVPSGTYFVRVQTANRTAVEKLIVK
ncbi:MAG: T9SS type A sorting domain-containing protein [Bacteroidales bacterium]|nr:T9SS type A sorting domain-containing protein [Bacteroidales bacterium]